MFYFTLSFMRKITTNTKWYVLCSSKVYKRIKSHRQILKMLRTHKLDKIQFALTKLWRRAFYLCCYIRFVLSVKCFKLWKTRQHIDTQLVLHQNSIKAHLFLLFHNFSYSHTLSRIANSFDGVLMQFRFLAPLYTALF